MQNVHFITRPDSKLSTISSRIEEIIKHEVPLLQEVYGFNDIFHITVHNIPTLTIPEQGCGGYTFSSEWMQITVDEENEKFGTDHFFQSIKETVVHEFNHIVRNTSVGCGDVLLESVISEGIATAFEQTYGNVKVPWGAYTDEDIQSFLEIAKSLKREGFESETNVHDYLLGTDVIPKYFGYKLGTYIVDTFREKNPEVSWKDLTKMSATEILKKSEVEFY